MTTAAFLNIACAAVGVEHGIAEMRIDPADAGALARYGETLVELSQRRFPAPWFDSSYMRQLLD